MATTNYVDNTTTVLAAWLNDVDALTYTVFNGLPAAGVDGTFLVSDGSTYVEESGATLRTSAGLGTGDSPTFTDITSTIGASSASAGTFSTLIGTTIDGIIGSVTPAAGTFTALTATGAFTSLGIDDNATSVAITIDANENVGIGIAPLTGVQLLLPQENDATTPTLAFGDGNTGFYEASDNTLTVSIAGGARWSFVSTHIFQGGVSNAARIDNIAATATSPSHSFTGDGDTGIGKAADDQLSLISGGVEFIRLEEATTDYIDFRVGAIAKDTGTATLVEVPTGGTTAQNEWLRVKVAGNVRYIPLWA